MEEDRMVAISFGGNGAITQKIYVNGIPKRPGTQESRPVHTPGHARSNTLRAAIILRLQEEKRAWQEDPPYTRGQPGGWCTRG